MQKNTTTKIKFPSVAGKLPKKSMFERYYATYYMYVLFIFKYMKYDIEYVGDTSIADGAFYVDIDDKRVVFDYSDHLRVVDTEYPCFKFHYSYGPTFFGHPNSIDAEKEHTEYKNLFPFSPISFYGWDKYYQLSNTINYDANNPYILNRQTPHGNAIQRRRQVQSLLSKELGTRFQKDIVLQEDFWNSINKCSVAVCVPGSRNDMLDRGHLQYLALGCCTISPNIINVFPFGRKLNNYEHYIECKADYSDIMEKVTWVQKNNDLAKGIGDNAKRLFLETCTPANLIGWVHSKLF